LKDGVNETLINTGALARCINYNSCKSGTVSTVFVAKVVFMHIPQITIERVKLHKGRQKKVAN
jgi:hypothetical protein